MVVLCPPPLSSQVYYVVICILCLFSSNDISHDLSWQLCYLYVDYFFILNVKPQHFFPCKILLLNLIKSCMKMGLGSYRLTTFLFTVNECIVLRINRYCIDFSLSP